VAVRKGNSRVSDQFQDENKPGTGVIAVKKEKKKKTARRGRLTARCPMRYRTERVFDSIRLWPTSEQGEGRRAGMAGRMSLD